MRPSKGCLEDHELLVMASGASASEMSSLHLHDCHACRMRLDRLQSELALLGSSDLDPPSTSCDAPLKSDGPGSQDIPAQSPESATQPWANGTTASPSVERNADLRREGAQVGHYRAMLAGVFPDIVEATTTPSAIGKYLVVGRFPGSGQAEVFRVVHPELRRDLVLKLAKRPIDDEGRSDVIVDGQRLAELEHPNIVRIHDLDFHEGRPYLVMEYIRGRTLGHYAREEPVTPRQAAALMAELAGAVAFAHHRGIVHQDIKPANVLIDEGGHPRLIDFGLSWQQDAWSGSSSGSEGGTFAFMAPEQARMDLDRVRPLSDVFALGGLLYFLLTGRGPFEASTPDESWERARRCEFDPSAVKKAGVPRRLVRICLKAMAANPRARFRSADALRLSLRRHLRLRRAAPVLGAIAIGLALLVPAWAFWPGSGHPPTAGPGGVTSGRGRAESQTGPEIAAPARLRVTRFEIPHFPNPDANRFDPRLARMLGRNAFTTREEDQVTVRAELSIPAYSYLIAFRPDGTDELCDPDDEGTRPARKPDPAYPPPEKSDERIILSEGAGLHAFAVVASHQPLPPYREWKRLQGPMPWSAKIPCEPGIVWRDDDNGLEPLSGENAVTRGKGVRARDAGGAIAKLASWLRGRPGIDVVAVEAFAVEPAAGP